MIKKLKLIESNSLTEDEDDLEKIEDKVEDNLEAQENLEDTLKLLNKMVNPLA